MPDVSPILHMQSSPDIKIKPILKDEDLDEFNHSYEPEGLNQEQTEKANVLGMPSHTKPHEYDHAIKLFNADREDEFIDYIYELNEKDESVKDSSFDSSVDLKQAVESQIKLRNSMKIKRYDSTLSHGDGSSVKTPSQ